MMPFVKHIQKSVLNSYSQIFFSSNPILSVILLLVSFLDYTAGLSGLIAVIVSIILTDAMGMDRATTTKGLYSFNNLLVGLGLGIQFQLSIQLLLIVVFASLLTTFITFAIQGVLTKYALPYLSIPFLIGIWISLLATEQFTALGLSARGIYSQSELFALGGMKLINAHTWLDNALHPIISSYLKSLGAIFFQYSVFAGILICIGLLIYSRIIFTLSILGYAAAIIVYYFFGIDVEGLSYSYIGFNYILASIAIGGYFLQASKFSYLSALLLLPVLILLTYGTEVILSNFQLSIYSLPFNIIVLLFLYALRFRTNRPTRLIEVKINQDTPEQNIYLQTNYVNRMRSSGLLTISLPFMGEWTINQGYNGKHTHKGDWRHGIDFIITNKLGKQYEGKGLTVEDYYCYGKNIIAPADGYVVDVHDGIEDNLIGDVDIAHNWGNTVVIQHLIGLCSQVSHLQKGSISVRKGDFIQKGQIIGKVGNTGRSPYPHLHFQIQAAPHVGAKTLDYPLSNYITSEKLGYRYHAHGTPITGAKLQNVVPTPLVASAFNFSPGQKITFELTLPDDNSPFSQLEQEYSFIVHSDIYNNTYLECFKTGAKAWFATDGQIFFFSNYEGDHNSFLYYFMLALFKVEMGYIDNIVIKDQIPTHLIFSSKKRIMQDFLAPFHHYLNANYELQFNSIDDEMMPTEVIFDSQIKKQIRSSVKSQYSFNITIDNKGIKQINIDLDGATLKAICTNNMKK